MPKTYTYKVHEVAVVFDGIPISGFAEGSVITIEQSEEGWSMQVGADGFVTRSGSANRTGTATITLMQTSDSNRYLASKYKDSIDNGAPPCPFMVKEKTGSGKLLFTASEAWVRGYPSAAYDKEAGPREWIIDMADLDSYVYEPMPSS